MNVFSSIRQKSGLSIPQVAELTGYTERTVYRWENGETSPRKAATELIRNYRPEKQRLESSAFRFIDLFAGIGGLRTAFETIGGECVFTSEWDKACQETYRANFVCDHPIAGDIRDFSNRLDDIPQHDVLLAGFPCQPFSIAGVSKKNALGRPHGFRCDTQGTLFFDLAQIIEHHQPAVFLLENVKNLCSHDKGKTFQVIRRTLEKELGYTIEYRVFNAKAWVPQNRERIFIAGFRKNTDFCFDDMQIPETWPMLATILHNHSEEDEPPYFENGVVGGKYTLTPRLWEYLQAYREKHRSQGNGFGFSLVTGDDTARTLSARYYKDGSEILIHQEGKRPRRLTPRECARLMGFDNGQKKFRIPVSDTQAYKQFGNSIVVPLVTDVARHMQPHILSLVKTQIKNQVVAG